MPAVDVGRQPARKRHLVITVHGIRTFGQWQERLESLVRASGHEAHSLHYKYGYFSLLSFFIPPLRKRMVRRFQRDLLAAAHGAWDRIDLVGHSFGTHLIGWGLARLPSDVPLRVDTVILAGSVLPENFDWATLLRTRVARVINDCGTRDSVLLLNRVAVPFTGMAGRVGFSGMTSERLRNRFFAFGHSGYFLGATGPDDGFMRDRWLPLLVGNDPAHGVDERETHALSVVERWVEAHVRPLRLTLLIAGVVSTLALVVAVGSRVREQRRAEQARTLTALARRHLSENPPRLAEAMYFAAAALARGPSPEADGALRDATAVFAPRTLVDARDAPRREKRTYLSPDGRAVATIHPRRGEDLQLQVRDVGAEAARIAMTLPERALTRVRRDVALSNRADRMVVIHEPRDAPAALLLADATTGETAPVAPWSSSDLRALSPDGQWLAIARWVDSPEPATAIEGIRLTDTPRIGWRTQINGAFTALAFSPDGHRVGVAGMVGGIAVLDTDTGSELGHVTAPPFLDARAPDSLDPESRETVASLALTPDAQLAAVTILDSIRGSRGGQRARTLAFSLDGRDASEPIEHDVGLRVWQFDPLGTDALLVGASHAELLGWRDGLVRLFVPDRGLHGAAISSDGSAVVGLTGLGVESWQLDPGAPPTIVRASPLTRATPGPGGERVALYRESGRSVIVCDRPCRTRSKARVRGSLRDVEPSADGKYVVMHYQRSFDDDESRICLFDMVAERCVYDAAHSWIGASALSSRDYLVYVAGEGMDDPTMLTVDDKGAVIARRTIADDPVLVLPLDRGVTPAAMLVVEGEDKQDVLRRLDAGNESTDIPLHGVVRPRRLAQVVTDGKRAFVAASRQRGSVVEVVDIDSPRIERTLDVDGEARWLAASPNGLHVALLSRRAARAMLDNQADWLTVWRVADGARVVAIPVAASWVWFDDDRLLLASRDRAGIRWEELEFTPERLVRETCRLLGGDMLRSRWNEDAHDIPFRPLCGAEKLDHAGSARVRAGESS